MQKICLLIFSFFLFQGSSAAGQEATTAFRKPATDEQGKYYHQMALEFGVSEPPKALSYADSLQELAQRVGDRKLLYQAYKVKGDLYRKTGNYNQAFFFFQNALQEATALADTLGMVKVYNNVGAVYQNTGVLDKALENYSQAFRLGTGFLDFSQKATVLLNMGLVHEELGQYQEALSYYQEALRLNEKEEQSISLGLVNSNLGALYSKLNNKEQALEHLKVARQIFEKQGDEPRLAEVLNEFALVYLKDNPEIALEYLNLSEKLYRKILNNAGLLETHKNMGEAYTILGNYPAALNYLANAYQYSDSLQNKLLKGDVLLKIAHLHELQEKFEEATGYYNQFFALDRKLNRNELVNNIANARNGFEIHQKDEKIHTLEGELALAVQQLRQQNLTMLLMAIFTLLAISMALFFGFKIKSARRLNILLKNRNQEVQAQKEEIKKQHQLIAAKKVELEKAWKQSEEYSSELYRIKDQLEEKVDARTRELEDAYRRLSFHINNTPLALLEWNNRLELVHWPKQAEVIFGFPAEEVLGLRIDEVPFLLAEDRVEVVDVVKQLCKGEQKRHYFTKKNINRNGDDVFVEWSYSALLSPEGELESILSIANNVTLREQANRELKNANQELDTFLYKSSHDLRGPIARMQGIINLGLLESKDKEAQLYFNMLNKVTDELNSLLLRLLMIHNINQHSYKEERISFVAYVNQLIAAHVRRKVSFQEVEIRNKVQADLVISSDATLLEILLVNLLENAMRFTDNLKPEVEIDAFYLPSGKYVISVMDNGPGVPAEFQEKVFDMFFQGSTRSTGPGLGLYMARKVVKRLGGDIKLYSENGHTVFEIRLPAKKAVELPKVKVLN